MIDLFYKGGPLMYPLLLGSVLMVAVIIERGVFFISTGVKRGNIEAVKQQIRLGNFENAIEIAGRQKGPVAAIIGEALLKRNSPENVIGNDLSIKGDHILQRLNKNLHLLELIGKIAPMVGLSGTVLGMVKAFKQIASVNNIVAPSVLAGGIWEALITTVAGLFVGIPALIFHHLYVNKLKSIAFSMKHYGGEMISMIRGNCDRV